MQNMKIKEKRVYLDKLISYLKDNGWDLCNYAKQQWSECDNLRMNGDWLLYEKFELVQELVELFETNQNDEAMDLYNSAVIEMPGGSMFDYYDGVVNDDNPWFV